MTPTPPTPIPTPPRDTTGVRKTAGAIIVAALMLSVAWLYNHRHARTLITPPGQDTHVLACVDSSGKSWAGPCPVAPPAVEPPIVDGQVEPIPAPAPQPVVHSTFCSAFPWADLPPGAYCRGYGNGELWRGGRVVRVSQDPVTDILQLPLPDARDVRQDVFQRGAERRY